MGEWEEGPSFSLGLDLDLHSSPQPPLSTSSSSSSSIFIIPDSDDDYTGRVLKRLRTVSRPDLPRHLPDDHIQPFSSLDTNDANKASSSHSYSGCSTSKLSLLKHKVLTTHSIGKYKITQNQQATVIPASTSTWTNNSKFTFPKLNVSPLRKIQLLDSESGSDSDSDSDSDFDDPCSYEYANKKANKLTLSSKAKLRNPSKKPTMSRQKRANAPDNVSQGHDFLCDDFYTEKRFSISTPALDEVCDEYFKSVKNNRTDPPGKNVGNCTRENNDNDGVHRKLDGPVPPAHHYFYHDNPMVGNLVRSRLPYFFPLDTTNGRNQQSVPSAIDYMSQFNHGASSTAQGSHMTNPDTSSKRAKKYSRKSNIAEGPEGSGGWVNPRSSVSIPTDAGKRRAHAVGGQSAGHWFTSPEGKKVYVSKTGQEFTGRVAYTHHKKENGKGFKRSRGKKKGAVKKQRVVKKKTAAKNR